MSDNRPALERAKCQTCEGFGFMDHGNGNSHTCMTCDGSGFVREAFTSNERLTLREELRSGGSWLAVARSQMQRAIMGDRLVWGSTMAVNGLSVCDIEEMAKQIAVEAILEDRARTGRRAVETGARHEPEQLCPEPVETLDVTHIFDGEEVVTAGEDGQTWIATFGCYSEAAEFVKTLQAEPGTTVVGLRNRRAVKSSPEPGFDANGSPVL